MPSGFAARGYDGRVVESEPLRYAFVVEDVAGAYGDERAATAWFERVRWPDGPSCPRCAGPEGEGGADPAGRRWCGSCRRRFSVRTGTVLEGQRVPLRAWAVGIVLSTNGPFVVRGEALRAACDLAAGAARVVSAGIRAACGGLVCRYDRPERLAARVLGVASAPGGRGDGTALASSADRADSAAARAGSDSPVSKALVGDWWRRLDEALPAHPTGRSRWLTPPRPVWDLAVTPPPHPRPQITRAEVLALSALQGFLEGAGSATVAQTAGITRRHAQRVLAALAADGYLTSAVRTLPWCHGTRRVRIWSLTEQADALSPYLPRLRRACRAACPPTLPGDLWHLFWSGPDPADIRLPRDALLVANRLLNGRGLDPDAKRWALRHLPLEALQAQTGIPGCPPDVDFAVRELAGGQHG